MALAKYQTETTGLAPIAALLLAAMMMASLVAMNLTAERALNPAFSRNPLVALARPITSAGISLRNAVASQLQHRGKGRHAGISPAAEGASRPALAVVTASSSQAVSSAPTVPAPVAGPPAPSAAKQAGGKKVAYTGSVTGSVQQSQADVKGKSRKGLERTSGKDKKRGG